MNQVLVVPYPGRGHINPVMNLCHLLSSRLFQAGNLTTVFTFFVTEEWLGMIESYPMPANVRFATIPNVIPSELNRGSDMIGFLTAVNSRMEGPFNQLLDETDLPVEFIISDACMRWPFDVAKRRNIPVTAYWPMSAAMFSLMYHVDFLASRKHLYVDLSERGKEVVDYIPGLSPITVADIPSVFHGESGRKFSGFVPDPLYASNKAHSMLLATIYELEPEAIHALKAKLQIPIYTLGPNIPNFRIQSNPSIDESKYLIWLDSRPPRTVLYISLGSYLSVSSAQMDEIAAGLKQSGVSFLWVARGETSRLTEVCGGGEGEGLVVQWCDQLRVLSHSSVGGFWSHCGWNSVKESLFSGMPMLTFPVMIDQFHNSKVVVDDWKVGWKVRKGMESGYLVKREEIAELVKKFMDSESTERKEMEERVKKLKEICQESVAEGGSATKDLDAFIKAELINLGK